VLSLGVLKGREGMGREGMGRERMKGEGGREGKGRERKERKGGKGKGREGGRERKEEFIPQCSLAVDATECSLVLLTGANCPLVSVLSKSWGQWRRQRDWVDRLPVVLCKLFGGSAKGLGLNERFDLINVIKTN